MLDGQSHSELVDQVTTLIGKGRLMNAVELLEAGIAEQPYNQQLRACWHYAFFPSSWSGRWACLAAAGAWHASAMGCSGLTVQELTLRRGEIAAARSELMDVINGAVTARRGCGH